MLKPPRLLLALLLFALLASALPAAAADTPAAGASDRAVPLPARGQGDMVVLATGGAGVTLEVQVDWTELLLQPVTDGGVQYVRVSLPGWDTTGEAGRPALPRRVRTLGVPFGARVTLSVVPGAAHTVFLPAPVLPVATQEVQWLPDDAALPVPGTVIVADPAVYGVDAPYPRELAGITGDGVMRTQRVAGTSMCPVQYDPRAQSLTVYESLRVEVAFAGAPPGLLAGPVAESAAYEELLREELVNYEAARGWRRTLTPPTTLGAPQDGMVTAAVPNPSPGTGEGSDALIPGSSPGMEDGSVAAVPWEPPEPAWRVKVQKDGFFKLTYTELGKVGVPVDSVNPGTFRMYHLGDEVAIYVQGAENGLFESEEYILFYGQAIDSKYTWDNIYWLTYDPAGVVQGLRMATRDGDPGDEETPLHYPAEGHLEENLTYLFRAPGDEDVDRWFWNRLTPPGAPTQTYTLTLAAPYAVAEAPEALLRVRMLGNLDDVLSPDHHVLLWVNGQQVGEVTWDGRTWLTAEQAFGPELLLAGDNIFMLTDPNDLGVGRDSVYVDWVEVEFPNGFVAEEGELPFRYDTNGSWKFAVSGFTSEGLAAYDVTDPARVARILNVGQAGSGSAWSAVFKDVVGGAFKYWALQDSAYHVLLVENGDIEQDTASHLASGSNEADHIVITHADFAEAAAVLVEHRNTSGLASVLVDVQDVYDEFNYGLVSPAAIHDFLAYAYQYWKGAGDADPPSYVVLVGDGHYDPKYYQPGEKAWFIPPYLAPVDPWITETAGDNRFVTLVGADTLPDMMLGRLAVNSLAEASAFITKIVAYEGAVQSDWQTQLLAVADNADTAGNFPQISEDLLGDVLPGGYTAERVYYGQTHTDLTATRAAILGGINAGKLIANYIGHSGVIAWANEAIFQTSDFGLLANEGMLPVMLPMTCYDGYYIYPQSGASYDAIGELVTRLPLVGAVASWSPTGLGVSTGHDSLDRGFLNAVFQDADGSVTVGQAAAAGKLAVFGTGVSLDLLDTYLLFGDPATRMALPAPAGVLGDVNGDDFVDSTDALIVLSADAGMDTAQFCPMNCGDVNADGYVDSTDALIILSYDAGMTVPFPVGQPGCPATVTQPPACGL